MMSEELISLNVPKVTLEQIKRDLDIADARWAAMSPEERRQYQQVMDTIHRNDPIYMLGRPAKPVASSEVQHLAKRMRDLMAKHDLVVVLPKAPDRH